MFDFFTEIANFFNEFINTISNIGIYDKNIWDQFKGSRIFEFLNHYRNAFPQPVSWAMLLVVFTTMFDFVRGRR